MPAADPLGFRTERFAALWAGCDAANANEAEAVGKFRELRRMVLADLDRNGARRRVIDVLGRADVMAALDVQLQPVREESPEVKAALEQAAGLREELTERTRNVRELAELLRRQEETTEGLRKELKAVTRQTGQRQASASAPHPAPARASSCSHCKAMRVGETFFDGLFALVIIWSGAALLFTGSCWAIKAVFGH